MIQQLHNLFPADALRRALEKDLNTGLQAAILATTRPFKRLAAAKALADFLHLHPEQIFPALDHLLRYPTTRDRTKINDSHSNIQLLLAELGGVASDSGLGNRLVRTLTAPLHQETPEPLQNLAKIYYAWLVADAPTRQDLIVLLSASLQILAACMWDELGHPPSDTNACSTQAQTRSAHLWMEVCQGFRAWKHFLEYENAQDLAQAPEQIAWLDECIAPLRPDILQALAWLGQVGREMGNWLADSRRQPLDHAQDLLEKVKSQPLPPPESRLATAVAQRWSQIIASTQA